MKFYIQIDGIGSIINVGSADGDIWSIHVKSQNLRYVDVITTLPQLQISYLMIAKSSKS